MATLEQLSNESVVASFSYLLTDIVAAQGICFEEEKATVAAIRCILWRRIHHIGS